MDGQMFDMHKLEPIKKTILMHEDIFRQQVRELHRLYERQKKLMYELKLEASMSRKHDSNSKLHIWHQPIQEIKPKFPAFLLGHDPLERASVSNSGGTSWTRPRGLNLGSLTQEPPPTSIRADIISDQKSQNYHSWNVNTSNVSNSDHRPDEEVDVELSLSIGCSSTSKKRLKQKVCSMDTTNSNGGGPCSSLNKRDSREQSLGHSGLALRNSRS